jgi:SPP1 gp7 family putative phage head morphogenesis protein
VTEAPSPTRTPLEQAIAWFRRRLSMNAREFYRLSAAGRRQAFTVSNVARMDVVNDVWRAIDRAVEQGRSLEDFQNEVKVKLMREWEGTNIVPASRMETIYRTNVSQAYNAGRHAQQTDPDVIAARPFWMYDALLDSSTSNLCMRLHGTILPADHEFWQTRYPPNHFNCRSGVRSLTRSGAERRGGVSPTAPELDPPPGFRAAPTPGEWEPDLSKYPQRVVAAYQRSLGGDPQ